MMGNAGYGAYDDLALRGMHRVATCKPDEPWPALVVERLLDEIIRRRGTDRAWLAIHPSPIDGTEA